MDLTGTAGALAPRRWPCAISSRKPSRWPPISYRRHSGCFCAAGVATGNIAEVAREMGKDRSHLSRDYRPRVVMVVTDVFMSLTGNGDRRARNTRPGRTRRVR